MYTYSIKGQATYNEADNEEGFVTVELNETVEVEEMSTQAAKEKFFEENTQYEFYGSLKTCDVETAGKRGATYKDQNEDQTIDVEIVD